MPVTLFLCPVLSWNPYTATGIGPPAGGNNLFSFFFKNLLSSTFGAANCSEVINPLMAEPVAHPPSSSVKHKGAIIFFNAGP
jgi:hypothetical protein